jgi:abhydrolase domain-containing protein 12
VPTTLPMSTDRWSQFEEQRQAHFSKREELVTRIDLGNFGTVDEFEQEHKKIILVKTQAGNHDYLGVQEGLQDIIRKSFGLNS